MELSVVLLKKFLLLLLVAGLVFEFSSSVFAVKGDYKSDTFFTVSENGANIMISIYNVLKISVCRDCFLGELNKPSILSVVEFCCQLQYLDDYI